MKAAKCKECRDVSGNKISIILTGLNFYGWEMHLAVAFQYLTLQSCAEWLQWRQHKEKLWGRLVSGCTDAVMRNNNIHSVWYSKDSGYVLSGSDANIMLLSRDGQTVQAEGMKQNEGTTLVFMCFVDYCMLKNETKLQFMFQKFQCSCWHFLLLHRVSSFLFLPFSPQWSAVSVAQWLRVWPWKWERQFRSWRNVKVRLRYCRGGCTVRSLKDQSSLSAGLDSRSWR